MAWQVLLERVRRITSWVLRESGHGNLIEEEGIQPKNAEGKKGGKRKSAGKLRTAINTTLHYSAAKNPGFFHLCRDARYVLPGMDWALGTIL